jgi:hypothetical protein
MENSEIMNYNWYCKKFLFKFYAKYPYVQHILNLLFPFNFCINFNASNIISSI